jgi:DNA mismatch endonuclease (patch repair protein)
MARIRSKDTGPEMLVRRTAHRLGFRFRLHRRDLPGAPDLVFPGRRTVIFVHGCFWHQHAGCRRSNVPKTREDYWLPKLARNAARDREKTTELERLGWRVAIIWECQTAEPVRLAEIIVAALASDQ